MPPPAPAPPGHRRRRGSLADLFALRKEIPLWQQALAGLLCVALVFGLWWYVTRGETEEDRILAMPSPAETFGAFPTVWYDLELTLNTLASLRRVVLGFGLGVVIGVPLGILCGCFPRVNAFFNPLLIFGRNIPIAALIFLLFAIFHTGELYKLMFLFFATAAFVVSDTARSIQEVGAPYVDTAYTLGASRRQVILKVLVPLAMPSVFNSVRLLFGLAFGYIMLVESMKSAEGVGGLGYVIWVSERRGHPEYILLILLVIPLVALALDRLLWWVQKELFPYRYGGTGLLNQVVSAALHAWDDLKCALRRSPAPVQVERKQP
jgi:NitT/TauT family transport system permease protein